MNQDISTPLTATRARAIDILRGAVMVLMAIDHVRVYAGIPVYSTDPAFFFTRWVTHFCVPSFVFLAGTSAFLYGQKSNDLKPLSRFLVTRGVLLIFLELTIIRLGWTFNLNFQQFTLVGVIWMLGWCMVFMSFLIRLPIKVLWIGGLIMIFIQQVFAWVPNLFPPDSRMYFGWFWEFIYSSHLASPPGITILYVLVPWIGVMAMGYGFGLVINMDPAKRKKICLQIGLGAIVLFFIAGTAMDYFTSSDQGQMPFLLRLLNQQKYPPSQLYLLMTLGPVIALIPFVEKTQGWFAGVLTIFGRVPMFYYLIHIPLIHLTALGVNYLRDGASHGEWYGTAPFTHIDEEHRWGLPLLYLVFFLVEIVLYFICKKYAAYKAKNPDKKWLKFI